MRNFGAVVISLVMAAKTMAATEQTCELRTHNGQSFQGRTLLDDDEFWVEAKGASESWALKYDRKAGLYVYKNGELFDSLNLYHSLRGDLQNMLQATSSMQMYFNKASWWQKHFTTGSRGKRLTGELLEAMSITLSPQSKGQEENIFSMALNPTEKFTDEKLSLEAQAVRVKLPLALTFAEQSAGETIKTRWYKEPFAPAEVRWQNGKRENVLTCKAPINVKSATKPQVKTHQNAGGAQRNFLQLVHAQGMLNILNHMHAKSATKRREVLSTLLTGICSKHLAEVNKQIEASLKDKTHQYITDKSFMKLVGSEFGQSVSAEFKPYQTILGQSVEKQQIIASYQSNCTDPLGLLIESYSAPLAH